MDGVRIFRAKPSVYADAAPKPMLIEVGVRDPSKCLVTLLVTLVPQFAQFTFPIHHRREVLPHIL